MKNQNESIYEQQEGRISKQSAAFFDLMKKRGLVPDNQIPDEKIRQVKQDVAKNAYHNTKVLLENYRSFQWVLECFPRNVAEELEKPFDSLDMLLDKIDIEMAMGNRKLEGKMQAVAKSRALLDRVNDALTILKKKPGNGERLYEIIYESYINPTELSYNKIIEKLELSVRQYYRLRKEAIQIISIRLWAAPEKEVEQWLEVLTLLESI